MGPGTENKLVAAALRLQQTGFRLFPLDGKLPLVSEFPEIATNDIRKLERWWTCPFLGVELHHNIGISTRNLVDGTRLIGVDIDNKKGREGDKDVVRLFLEGKEFPDTFEQRTTAGGRHLVYRTTALIGNSSKRVSPGIDIRGRGGYLVGAGSELGGKLYTANWHPITEAPAWLVTACQEVAPRSPVEARQDTSGINQRQARARGEVFVRAQPGAVSGTRGSTALRLAYRLRDFGIPQFTAYEILAEYWAERCEPAMTGDEDEQLVTSVENAYRFPRDAFGNAAPENAFPDDQEEEPEEKKLSPVENMNMKHAFVITGGDFEILWEAKDEKGVNIVKHLKPAAFHAMYASKSMIHGGKSKLVTRVWMSDPKRRSYDGYCYRPGLKVPDNFYNFWRGFTCQPMGKEEIVPPGWQKALDDYLQHTLINICGGDEKLFHWLIGYAAHAVQRPWDKPRTCLVFQGRKGVGKSFFAERIGELFGQHFFSVADQRYLGGNFNSHLEQCNWIVYEEAFWSGDKKIDGVLKNLITGKHHVIERKGHEPYKVDNCTRVIVIGNEKVLVPATEDERRYAVFNVGEGKRNNIAFFRNIQEQMEAGGYRLLLTYLLSYDISDVEVNVAPKTEALLDQKTHFTDPIKDWWYESVFAGEIDGEWPERMSKNDLYDAFVRHHRAMTSVRYKVPGRVVFGKTLHQLCPSLIQTKWRKDGDAYNAYRVPPLETVRKELSIFLEQEIAWE